MKALLIDRPDRGRGEFAVGADGDIGATGGGVNGGGGALLGPDLVPPQAGEAKHLELLFERKQKLLQILINSSFYHFLDAILNRLEL